MPQLNNSDDAANDEPTSYNVEECEDDPRWNENLSDIKGALVDDLDRDTSRGANTSKSDSHGESSNKSRQERDDSRDDAKGPGRPYPYPHDIGSIVSSLPPSFFQNGGLPPNSKVPYPYNPYHLLYGTPGDDAKGGMSRGHHPDIPAMYPLPGQLGHIPHPLAPWPTAPIYPMCTASTIAPMLRYPNPFAAFTSAAAVAASNMPHFPRGAPGMHPTMIPHPALVSNGPLGNMGNGQHPHHGKHDDKMGGRHSKSESEHGVGRAKRDRPYVKKPLNAFMLYMKEQRAKVVAECTLKESAAINQILGRKWHSLSREEQQKYYEMARKERQLHLQMYPGWSARDNYGKRKKRKKEKTQGECTAQNPKKCRAVFGLEQQQLWCAPCRRKKKCVRYQHDDDSDDDDLSPLSSPQQYQGFPGQGNPFDTIRSTSPLSMTSQSINNSTNGNGEFNPATTSSSSRLPGNHVSPQLHPHGLSEGLPDIKQEYRTSPTGMDGASNSMVNGGNNFDQFNGRHPGRTSSSENSFKSEGSPHSQGGDSNGGRGNNHHDNENNNNSNHKDQQQRRPNFNNRGIPGNNPSQNIIHRQASAPLSGNENRSSFRKTNSLDSSDMPGPSGLSGRRNSHLQGHNTSANSNASDGSPGLRTNHKSSFSKPSSSGSHMPPHPSPLHPYLPNQSGTSPLLPVSPTYNHSPHAAPFIPPYSPYLPTSMLAAFGTPPSPLGSPLLSIFKGMSPSSIGGGMGGPSAGSSHGNTSRVTPSAVVEGKS